MVFGFVTAASLDTMNGCRCTPNTSGRTVVMSQPSKNSVNKSMKGESAPATASLKSSSMFISLAFLGCGVRPVAASDAAIDDTGDGPTVVQCDLALLDAGIVIEDLAWDGLGFHGFHGHFGRTVPFVKGVGGRCLEPKYENERC